jgi:hypothetical protein
MEKPNCTKIFYVFLLGSSQADCRGYEENPGVVGEAQRQCRQGGRAAPREGGSGPG